MNYISTRGKAPAVSSAEALVNGIAPDGGLYLPEVFPSAPAQETWLSLDFGGIMAKVLSLFFPDLPESARLDAVQSMLSQFETPPIPLHRCGQAVFLELFHGPTRAFKDVALTVLPVLLQTAAKMTGHARVGILTATSGDTGSAAMSGFSEIPGTEVLVFYPQYGTSEIQRRQMVCCPGKNVSACAVEGNFDDAQSAVKAIFTDPEIRAAGEAAGIYLSSANSINIGRLFPQVSYYIEAWVQGVRSGMKPEEVFDVVVPTGNFGNVLAAYYARKLGVPIRRLVTASNENHGISDLVNSGVYDRRRHFTVTNSPSMDILISSNTERLLFELAGRDSLRLNHLMNDLKQEGCFTLSADEHAALSALFAGGWVGCAETESAIRTLWETEHYLADPHTAVAWKVWNEWRSDEIPALIAATASPWKFPRTMIQALGGRVSSDAEALLSLSALSGEPADFTSLLDAPILHSDSIPKDAAAKQVRKVFRF